MNIITLYPHESAAISANRLGCIVRLVERTSAFDDWHDGNCGPNDAYGVWMPDDQSGAEFLVAGDQGFTDLVPSPFGPTGTVIGCREEWIYSGSCSSYSYNSKSFVEYVTYAACGTKVTISVTEEIARAVTDAAIEYQNSHCPKITVDEEHNDFWDQWEAKDEWLNDQFKRVRPASEMPDWAIRHRVIVGEVRCVRVQDVDLNDWYKAGIKSAPCARCDESGEEPSGEHKGEACEDCCGNGWNTISKTARELFNSIHGPGSWERNPWLWLATVQGA
jgi:hypothetical protein